VQVARFVITTGDQPFIQDYINILRSGDEVSVTEWLLANYKRMNELMFYDQGWEALNPDEILTLRIYAPTGVFTETAKNGFLSRVGSDPKWAYVLKSVFTPYDIAFLSNLPEAKQPATQTLLLFAYSNRIRPADPAVKKSI
jgi:hypothetical protein